MGFNAANRFRFTNSAASSSTTSFTQIVWCGGCLGSLAMLIISFVYANLARKEFTRVKDSFGSLVSNWDSDLVFDLTSDPSYALPDSSYYLDGWTGQWPGTKNSCYCNQDNASKTKYAKNKVLEGTKDRDCNSTESYYGCVDIPATDSKTLENWINGQKMYAVKIKDTSFLDTYNDISSDGKCKSVDLMHCGNINSKSKGVCLPSKIGRCPLTDLSSNSVADYNTSSFVGFSLYHSSSNQNNPLSDLAIREHHLCFIRSQYPLTPGRSKYILMLGEYEQCRIDNSAWHVGEMDETTFYDINNLNYKMFPEFGSTDRNKMRMIGARTFDWTPGCSDTVPTMASKQDDLKVIDVDFRNLIVVYSIAFGFTVIVLAGLVCSAMKYLDKNGKIYKCLFVARILFFIMALPSLVISYKKVRDFYKYFERINELSCSTPETAVNFDDYAATVKDNTGKKAFIAFMLFIFGFVVDIIICMIYLWCIKKQPDIYSSPANPTSKYAEKQILPKIEMAQVEGVKDNTENKSNPGKGEKNVDGMQNRKAELFSPQKEQLPNTLNLAKGNEKVLAKDDEKSSPEGPNFESTQKAKDNKDLYHSPHNSHLPPTLFQNNESKFELSLTAGKVNSLPSGYLKNERDLIPEA